MRKVSLVVAAMLLAAGAAAPAAVAAPALQGKVPACVTPEALMQIVAERNQALDPRFKDIARLYQQHGQELGLRWDYAFFQMLVETGHLSFKGSVRNGLKPAQNNFASIGATGTGNSGERFADVATGVQAHLQHIRLYAGEPVDQPAARRTREVQGFVLAWSRGLGRRATYADLAERWAPNDQGYAGAIEQLAQGFKTSHCKDGSFDVAAASDEDEERSAYSGRKKSKKARSRDRDQEETAAASDDEQAEEQRGRRSKGDRRKSRRDRDEERVAGKDGRSGKRKPSEDEDRAASAADEEAPGKSQVAAQSRGEPQKPSGLGAGALAATAGAGGRPPLDGAPKGADNANCKVWTASFGGNKSVLIRVMDGAVTHFTALEVHAGREQEETKAYIAAYARGGKIVGEPFGSPEQAINKAFELCPKT